MSYKYNTKHTLHPPSAEQVKIIDDIYDNNVIVDSVAGSGKTTTNLHIAKKYKHDKILLLTYNKALRLETKQKTEFLNIDNVDVHTYHSFAVKYYNPYCYEDHELSNMLKENTKPSTIFGYDILIFDEAQDIKTIFYKLICKIVQDNYRPYRKDEIRICVLGDKYQSIYGYAGADPRFITMAEKIFTFNNRTWVKHQLTLSFRLTQQIAKFVNVSMLNENRIVSEKNDDIKVRYVTCNTYSNEPYGEVIRLLKDGYRYEDIFILSPSLKSRAGESPVARLANQLSLHKIKIFVPEDDDEKCDENLMIGKIAFTTFHQSKGLERKAVIILNFDSSYFNLYKRDYDRNSCPNELYVATTRASKELIVIQDKNSNPLPALKLSTFNNNCDFCYMVGKPVEGLKDEIYSNGANRKEHVTSLLKHLDYKVIRKALSYIECQQITSPSDIIAIPTVIDANGLKESVSAITGRAIISYFELQTLGKMSIDEGEHKTKKIKSDELLRKATTYHMYDRGYLFKMMALMARNDKLKRDNSFVWLCYDALQKSYQRLFKLKYPGKSIFEMHIPHCAYNEAYNVELSGDIDFVNGNNVWEFKCVSKLSRTHILQISLYAYIFLKYKIAQLVWKKMDFYSKRDKIIEYYPPNSVETKKFLNTINNSIVNIEKDINILKTNSPYKFYLYNVLDGEHIEIISTLNKLKDMTNYLITSKYMIRKGIDDDTFLTQMTKIRNKYIPLKISSKKTLNYDIIFKSPYNYAVDPVIINYQVVC